jgi:maltose alpha-D-glucosyltransferase/alpha-amylase
MRYLENLTSVEGGYNRTGSRSPMQWNSGVNDGFSMAAKEKLYIRQDERADRPTVEKQQADPDSLYHEIKKLIQIRQAHKALQSKGEITFVCAEKDKYPFAYVRSMEEEKILVVLNPSGREAELSCSLQLMENIYSFGGEARIQNGKMLVPACFAGFWLLGNEE